MKASFQRADLFVFTDFVGDLFLPCAVLFSYAEIPEDISQNFVGGDFTDDGAEVVDALADVLGDEFCRDAEGEAFAGAEKGSAGVA